MIKSMFLVLLLLLVAPYSFSQSRVSGYVYNDNGTDSLLALAKVKVVLRSKNIKKIDKTDKSGFYSIQLDAVDDTVHVSFLKKKYSSLEVDLLKGNTRIDIILRRLYSLHDVEYGGSSEILLLKKDIPPANRR